MEPPPTGSSGQAPYPDWIEGQLVSDARFARAYEGLGDRRRALLKGVIARHHAMDCRSDSHGVCVRSRYGFFEHASETAPVSFALLVLDEALSAPALLLAALMPVLCARVPHVLVARLGRAASLADETLCACELAGQERLAVLGPRQLSRLLGHLAAQGRPGVVLHPRSAAFAAHLATGGVSAQLHDASSLRLVALRAPRLALLSGPGAPNPEDLAMLYGPLRFESADHACAARADLHLLPDDKAGQDVCGSAAVTVGHGCAGMWRWPELGPGAFSLRRETFASS